MKRNDVSGYAQRCPACGYEMDSDTDAFGDARPKPEDVSVCLKCATFLVFNHDMSRRQMTHEDEAALDAETRAALWRVRRAIEQMRIAGKSA